MRQARHRLRGRPFNVATFHYMVPSFISNRFLAWSRRHVGALDSRTWKLFDDRITLSNPPKKTLLHRAPPTLLGSSTSESVDIASTKIPFG